MKQFMVAVFCCLCLLSACTSPDSEAPTTSEHDLATLEEPSSPPISTIKVDFAASVINEMGTIQEETVDFSLHLPSDWTVDGHTIWKGDNQVAEILPARMNDVYVQEHDFDEMDYIFSDNSVTIEEFTAGVYPAKYYHIQFEEEIGGLTALQNDLIFCILVDNRMVLIQFYPVRGIGIGTQREEFMAVLDTFTI